MKLQYKTTKTIAYIFGMFLIQYAAQAQESWQVLGNKINGVNNGSISDQHGTAVNISKDGSTIAVGAPLHTNTGGNQAGRVQIFSWSGSTWVLKGAAIMAAMDGENFGEAVSLSQNGNCVAIGGSQNIANGFNSGVARVYTFTGAAWTQLGTDIAGSMSNQELGKSVSLSANGAVVAIGAPGSSAESVKIFSWNGTAWTQRGSDITSFAQDEYNGGSVSLSAAGDVVAIGAKLGDISNTNDNNGAVRVFNWNGSTWNLMGARITGSTNGDNFGTSVSLSSNGTVVGIGAPNSSGGGYAQVFAWSGSDWVKKGTDFNAPFTGDRLGTSIALSKSGDTLALGASESALSFPVGGYAFINRWNGTAWVASGTLIQGSRENDYFGTSVSLSNDGRRMAVGAPGPQGFNTFTGTAFVYALSCSGVTSITGQPISQTVCGSNLATFDVTVPGLGLTYLWSNGETTKSIQTSTAGNYTVTITGACGTAISNNVNLTTSPSTQITTQPSSQTICGSNLATIGVTATGQNLSYLWSNGATTQSIQPTLAGSYQVTVSGTCGSVASGAVQLAVSSTTITAISSTDASVVVGFPTKVNVNALGTNLSYLWSNGATTKTVTGIVAGEYFVTVTGTCGYDIKSISIGSVLLDADFSGFEVKTNFGSSDLVSPYDIKIASDKKIYVSEFLAHRVSVWTQSGNDFRKVTSFGYVDEDNNIRNATGIAIGADGKIYVAERAFDRVTVWTQSGNTYTKLTTFGVNQISGPEGIAIGSDGRIYVADASNHRISVWTQNGNSYSQLTTFGSVGAGLGQFNRCFYVEIASDGKIFVSDVNNSRISVWTQNGNNYSQLTTFGSRGTQSGQFNQPAGISIDVNNRIYIVDKLNNRISVWTQSGNNFGNLTTFGKGKKSNFGLENNELTLPTGVLVTKENNILVADNVNNRITVWQAPAPIFYLKVIFDITAPTTFTGKTATLTWPTISGNGFIQVKYCIRISKDRSMGTGVKTVCGLTTNSYTYDPKNPNGRTEEDVLTDFFWQVAGVDSVGNQSQWSEIQTFSLDANATGLESSNRQSVLSFSIYPNPANTEITVTAPANSSLVIYNYLGTVVLSKTLQTTESKLDISSLPTGVYMVKVGEKVVKLMKL